MAWPIMLPLAGLLALALSAPAAQAQWRAAAAADPAALAASRPGPRLLTPDELRNSATAPDEFHPGPPVTHQITVPLGRTPGPPLLPARRPVRAASASPLDDAAARCEAQRGEQVRAACRAQLARESARESRNGPLKR